MSELLPSVTVLIAARPGQAEIQAVAGARQLDYPKDRLDILVARGKQPSVQRNTALKAARGELIYFLDDDSVPEGPNLQRALRHFTRPEVKVVGGPNLCPAGARPLEQAFALVQGSRLAFASSRSRYAIIGDARETSEKELILCNLVARRDALLERGGFNEALYPNEENALMDELQKSGGKLIYDPGMVVYRRPRATLKAFAKMAMTYGRGRAEQFRLHPTAGSAMNFVPPLFLLYLVSLAALPWFGWLLLLPLALYGIAVTIQAAALQSPNAKADHGQAGRPRVGLRLRLASIPLTLLTHVMYGAGFWRGLVTRLRPNEQRSSTPVSLETIPL